MQSNEFKISVSKLNDADMCLRHWHWQHVAGVEVEIPPNRMRVIEFGQRVESDIEAYLKGEKTQLSGPAAALAAHAPKPGQRCVDVQRWIRGQWAGALCVGKIDLLTGPSTIWNSMNRPQKKGMVRITDWKVVKDLKWAKTAEQIDRDRQLLSYGALLYREREKEIPPLMEVSQSVVERTGNHTAQSIVRVVSRKQVLEREAQDVNLVSTMRSAQEVEDTLELDPTENRSLCNRWYGSTCPFFERCWGNKKTAVPETLGALLDAEAGRGSSGASRTVDEIARTMTPGRNQQQEEKEDMVTPPDAAKPQGVHEDGELRHRTTLVGGKPYQAIQGERHGAYWELRCLGGRWKLIISPELEKRETSPGFRHVLVNDKSRVMTGERVGCEAADIAELRKIYEPILRKWDDEMKAKEEPKAETSPPDGSDDDDVFNGAASTAVEQTEETPQESGSRNVELCRELESVGMTATQSASLVEGGITLERLRGGSVSQSDLERCRGIGKKTAETILGRFRTEQKREPDPESEERPETEKASEPKQDAEPAQKHEPVRGYHIFLNCQPIEGRLADGAQLLSDVLRPYLDAVAAEKKVPDVSCVEPGYLVPGLVMEKIMVDPPSPCSVVVDTREKGWSWVRRFFLDHRESLTMGM